MRNIEWTINFKIANCCSRILFFQIETLELSLELTNSRSLLIFQFKKFETFAIRKIPRTSNFENPKNFPFGNFRKFQNFSKFYNFENPQTSSVNPERLFSAAGSAYTEKWNRLSPDNAEKLLFIMKNIKIVDFMYSCDIRPDSWKRAG